MALSKQDVDARVQAAVENLQAGRGVEDDAGIEFKADWPDPTLKARQLAGAANALRGELLVYVIGVDDKTGEVTVPKKTEPQEWYAKVRKRFDQIPPELLWVQSVFIGEDSESVLALVFTTDEFPYVINVENRREVPLRVGTGTESARRNQLIRMLAPSARTPGLSLIEASVWAEWNAYPRPVKDSSPQQVERVQDLVVSLNARVFVEHVGEQPSTLPVRDMRVRVACSSFEVRPDISVRHLGSSRYPVVIPHGEAGPPEPVAPPHGVYARDQQVIAISPGEFEFSASQRFRDHVEPDPFMDDAVSLLRSTEDVRLDLALRVVGTERRTKLSATLQRSEEFGCTAVEIPGGTALAGTLGTWSLVLEDDDPWGA
ncbi:hypothetical protein [Nocardioides sp.]|uniref:hypothetical protein n=1 Tax=Nocardioides sp. TaxID=35761 RepID=UPI0026114D3C|nr:hypothetical protein [Nocardioides sp.]MCW2738849.1 hypothetical protein [Nocardioides sp.]